MKVIDKSRKGIFDWEFNTVTHSDFKAKISIYTSNRVIKLMFNTAKKEAKKRSGVKISDTPEAHNLIEIPKRFFKLLMTAINKQCKEIFEDVAKDGIEVLRAEVKEAAFVRNKKDTFLWQVDIIIGGQYIDKR